MYDRVKCTARVLLADPNDRLLLACCVDEVVEPGRVSRPERKWVTVGGSIEPGETAREAAEREVMEETGLRVEIGPAIWFGEHVLMIGGLRVLHKETFFTARTTRTELSSAGWTEVERALLRELRWWTPEDLRRTEELVYPRCLTSAWPDVLSRTSLQRVDL